MVSLTQSEESLRSHFMVYSDKYCRRDGLDWGQRMDAGTAYLKVYGGPLGSQSGKSWAMEESWRGGNRSMETLKNTGSSWSTREGLLSSWRLKHPSFTSHLSLSLGVIMCVTILAIIHLRIHHSQNTSLFPLCPVIAGHHKMRVKSVLWWLLPSGVRGWAISYYLTGCKSFG